MSLLDWEEWEEVLGQLSDCSSALRSINKRITKYLDSVENNLRSALEIKPEVSKVCGFCFRDTDDLHMSLIECEHARLCAACAPCDQCDL